MRVDARAHRRSAVRAPRVEGQPRGGGASGPATIRECVEIRSGSEAGGESRVTLGTACGGTPSVTAQAGIDAHAPLVPSAPQSLDAGE